MTPNELKARRASLGFTQSEFAELLGYRARAVRSWESGFRPIPETVVLIIQLRDALAEMGCEMTVAENGEIMHWLAE